MVKKVVKKVVKTEFDLDSDIASVMKDIADVESLSTIPDVKTVPTLFSSFNRATKANGLPVRGTTLAYGPSGEGKSVLAAGLIMSFYQNLHIPVYIDTDMATDKDWWKNLGVPGNLPIIRPDNYEEAVVKVDAAIVNFIKKKKSGIIHPDRCMVVIIDTIDNLVSEKEYKKIFSKQASKTDRSFPVEVLLTELWMKRMVPIIGKNDISFVAITQERDKMGVTKTIYTPEHQTKKHKGGDRLFYNSSLVLRITSPSPLKEEIDGKKVEVGKIHDGYTIKNKVGFNHEPFRFYTISSNKGSASIGFDFVREAVDEAKLRGFIKKDGKSFFLDIEGSEAKGLDNIIMELRENDELYEALVEALDELNNIEKNQMENDDEEEEDE